MDEPGSEWAWISLGSNVGDRGGALGCLRRNLHGDGVEIAAASPEILTRPVGVAAQADFHNQMVLLRSPKPLPAGEWLRRCQLAETECGRRQTYRWGPRRADADVVLLGRNGEVGHIGDPHVPHPELRRRRFWDRLIREIDPTVADSLSRRLEQG